MASISCVEKREFVILLFLFLLTRHQMKKYDYIRSLAYEKINIFFTLFCIKRLVT